MAKQQCPYCPSILANKASLRKHKKRQHPDISENNENGENEELDIELPEGAENNERGYHCVNCGHTPIKLGQEKCPECGTTFDWSMVNNG